MRDYVHKNAGEETPSVIPSYTIREEVLLDLDDRELLYLLGDTSIGSACVGAGILTYIFVPGFVVEWHTAALDDGSPVSLVEPVTDEETRARIRALLGSEHPGLQVCF